MSAGACSEPLDLETLLAYRQGELSEAETERVEEHYFGCGACTRQLEAVERLAAGVAALVRSGRAFVPVTLAQVVQAEAEGLRAGDYFAPPGGSFQCTLRPDHDFNITRFALPDLEDDESVSIEFLPQEGGADRPKIRLDDVPVDREHGQIVLFCPGAMIRALPDTTFDVLVHAGAREERRPVASYQMFHRRWRD